MMAEDGKFVLLIQSRELIYNPRLKEHFNRNMVENTWIEVAEEMNMSVTECKQKWTNLRNSFARHLRNQSRPPDSGVDVKPRWYLADAMSFLEDHMQQRKPRRNSSTEFEEQDTIQQIIADVETVYSVGNEDPVQERTVKRPSTLDITRKVRSKRRTLPPFQQLVGPMIESNTNKQVQDHPLVDFVRGMIPDYNSLTPRRQRLFRQKIVTIMNELMDEQEVETSLNSAALVK